MQPFEKGRVLRLGTRGSLLARAQSGLVASELEQRHPGLRVELVTITTTGDVMTDRSLHDAGGKGLFVKELELALLDGQVDFAVHSYKDVPVTMPVVDESALVIAATPPREDPRDVIAVRDPASPGPIPPHARVGTSSLRRRCQLLELRDLTLLPVRGNIDTRLRKLRAGEFDAIVLAMAGLKRAGLFDPAFMRPLDPFVEMLPAPGQGALAIQCRRDDDRTRDLVRALHDGDTERCVNAERALVRKLDGDCHSPIAALAVIRDGQRLFLSAAVGARDGTPPVLRADASGADDTAVVEDCFGQLAAKGASEILRPRC